MSTYRITLCALFAISTLLATSNAAAEHVEAMSRARELFQAFEYDDAIEVLETVVQSHSAPADQRIRALELSGTIRVLQDDQDAARELFNRLLSLDPGHEIENPDIPPRVFEQFNEAREATVEFDAPTLDVQVPDAPSSDSPFELAVLATGETAGLAAIVLFIRDDAENRFRARTTTRSGNEFTAEVEIIGGEPLEYYVEARAPSGHVLSSVGSAEDPHSITARVEPTSADDLDNGRVSRPWYRRWWVWTLVGAVIVGGTATGLAIGLQPEEHENGTLGSVEMPLTIPDR